MSSTTASIDVLSLEYLEAKETRYPPHQHARGNPLVCPWRRLCHARCRPVLEVNACFYRVGHSGGGPVKTQDQGSVGHDRRWQAALKIESRIEIKGVGHQQIYSIAIKIFLQVGIIPQPVP